MQLSEIAAATRRRVWLALFAIAAIIGMVFFNPPPSKARVTVLYVGAEDCAPCQAWRDGAGAIFHASPQFAHLTYREVKSPTLLDVLKDENWPEDLRGYRGHIGRDAGVPLWLVISGDQIVAEGFGASQWHSAILPKIESLLH